MFTLKQTVLFRVPKIWFRSKKILRKIVFIQIGYISGACYYRIIFPEKYKLNGSVFISFVELSNSVQTYQLLPTIICHD